MEIQFRQQQCAYLKHVAHELKTQEQTQELRLPENMPDIGRVLGCWGQPIVRGKEWRGNGMSLSGGVMAWVFYVPEEGAGLQSVECWIPFQMKWDFPPTERDSFMLAQPQICAMDARSTSARKLMVRVNIGAMGQALEPAEEQIPIPSELDEDIQLKMVSYPMELAVESGEKLFEIEEELPLGQEQGAVEKILYYSFQPRVVEDKIMGGRLVFRGMAGFEMLYLGENEEIKKFRCDLPFSQYSQLGQDISQAARSQIPVAVTSLDLVKDENGTLRLRCTLAAQYVIYDRVIVELCEDSYSNEREIQLVKQTLELPMRLDFKQETLEINGNAPGKPAQILHTAVTFEQPTKRQSGDMTQLTLPVCFQVLYVDEDGQLQIANIRKEELMQFASDDKNYADISCCCTMAEAYPEGDGIGARGQWEMGVSVFCRQGLEAAGGMELGQKRIPEADRPSLIIMPMNEGSLWDIAKSCGSTVDAILSANQLQQAPEKGKMLYIPVP